MSHQLLIKDLTVSYNRIPAVHHLNAALPCGARVGLLGPNGAGKSTLLKTLAGLIRPETGSIEFQGHAFRGSQRAIAYLPQRESVDWDFPITVRGLAEMGRYPQLGAWGKFGPEDARRVHEALEMMHLADFADRQISALSGGQQQRAFLARAWAQQSQIYLLDEPFTGLDRNSQEHFSAAIRRLSDNHKIVVASHHELRTVPELFDYVILLNGELVAAGPTSEVFTPENIEKTFSIDAFAPHSHA
ncbi:MAG TPA: metal ABC transporter ATP-binding protein [Chthoniobacterales bacterium]